MSEKTTDEAPVRYILRLKKNLMVFNDQFSDFIIDTGQTFRVHKQPFITLEKRELNSQIVIASLIGTFDEKQIETIKDTLIAEKIISYDTGLLKNGQKIFKKVDKKWYVLPPEDVLKIEAVYFCPVTKKIEEHALQEA